MPWIYLVLVAVVLVVGLGVLLVNRRRSARAEQLGEAGPGDVDRPPPRTPRPASSSAAGIDASPIDVAEFDEPTELEEYDFEDASLDEVALDGTALDGTVRPSFRDRMAKARSAFAGAFLGVRGRGAITDDTWDDLEEALLRADVGVRVTDELLEGLRARVKAKEIVDPDALLAALQTEMTDRLDGADRALRFEPAPADQPSSPNVWLFVGVNGVGKTTTIGKVGAMQRSAGRTVLMAAGDTFRAAAAEQLGTWAERSGAELVRGNEGGDPSAVIFDGVERANARGIDLVLGDTAGRLHTKTNLMEELRKVRRVAEKGAGRVTEVLLVIDATTGQNGLTQAREFGDASAVTGVVLTKLDGSAKGGIVFAIETELGLPVKLVGLGETIDDLVPFDPHEFVGALFAD